MQDKSKNIGTWPYWKNRPSKHMFV